MINGFPTGGDAMALQQIFQDIALLKQLIGTQLTSQQLQQYSAAINNQLGYLQTEINTINAQLGTINTQISLILNSGIINPGFYSINHISNPAGDIEFIAGSGILISGNPASKTVTIIKFP